jgi:hypothetical protein
MKTASSNVVRFPPTREQIHKYADEIGYAPSRVEMEWLVEVCRHNRDGWKQLLECGFFVENAFCPHLRLWRDCLVCLPDFPAKARTP